MGNADSTIRKAARRLRFRHDLDWLWEDELYAAGQYGVWKAAAQYTIDRSDSPLAYAYTVAVNAMRGELRRHFGAKKKKPIALTGHDFSDESAPEPQVVFDPAPVRRAIASLAPRLRGVAEDYYVLGELLEDSARKRGIPYGTAKRRLLEARAVLKKSLAEIGYEK